MRRLYLAPHVRALPNHEIPVRHLLHSFVRSHTVMPSNVALVRRAMPALHLPLARQLFTLVRVRMQVSALSVTIRFEESYATNAASRVFSAASTISK